MTRSLPYQKLLNRLIALEPRSGYSNPAQIGTLTNAEVATVITHEPTVLADACTGDALVTFFVTTLGEQAFSTIETAALLGAALQGALAAQVRSYLLDEVQEQIAVDEERRLADESDARCVASLRMG